MWPSAGLPKDWVCWVRDAWAVRAQRAASSRSMEVRDEVGRWAW